VCCIDATLGKAPIQQILQKTYILATVITPQYTKSQPIATPFDSTHANAASRLQCAATMPVYDIGTETRRTPAV
jgi:hypothetical protein